MNMLKRIPLELLFWIGALILLGMAEPHGYNEAHHFSLCPLAAMGVECCPGCGLGRSITQLFHGHIEESWKHHWFGIPALLIIGYRIVVLTGNKFRNLKIKYKEDRYV